MDLFIVCMEAGLSLNASVHRVANEIKDVSKDFYDELQITTARIAHRYPLGRGFRRLGEADRRSKPQINGYLNDPIEQEWALACGQAFRTPSDFPGTTGPALRREGRQTGGKDDFPSGHAHFPAMFIVTVGPAIIHIKAILKLFRP